MTFGKRSVQNMFARTCIDRFPHVFPTSNVFQIVFLKRMYTISKTFFYSKLGRYRQSVFILHLQLKTNVPWLRDLYKQPVKMLEAAVHNAVFAPTFLNTLERLGDIKRRGGNQRGGKSTDLKRLRNFVVGSSVVVVGPFEARSVLKRPHNNDRRPHNLQRSCEAV
jgi:hypothetical protein